MPQPPPLVRRPSPSYLKLFESGELAHRAAQAAELLRECRICPRDCGVNRTAGEIGVCGVDARIVVSSAFPHYGEEPPLVGRCGSGTIFLAGCNLKCIYCQNFTISWEKEGKVVSEEELSGMMLALQRHGCHNVNFVTPSHYVPQILGGVLRAARAGLSIPIVYNSGGYDLVETLQLLDGVVDIYMPDIKYASKKVAADLSKAADYPERSFAAVREMHRQVGNLRIEEDSVASRGLLVRHLVLPNGLAGSEHIFRFLAEEISSKTYVNVMDQYHPEYRAREEPALSRRATPAEYRDAVRSARRHGLHRGFLEA
jgi:putative pyruvate formate lyase activating enzyme